MTRKQRSIFNGIAFVIVAGLLGGHPIFGQSGETYVETRRLLSEMGSNRRVTPQLTTLFRVGDERIHDLTKALDDSNEDVRLNAQVVIRYLGNEQGMNALLTSYSKADPRGYIFAGPAPLPMHEVDYRFISSLCSGDLSKRCVLPPGYLFALAHDGSARATSLLREVMEHEKKRGNEGIAQRYTQSSSSDQLIAEEDHLAEAVLKKASFLSARERRLSTARFVSYNGAKDKALLEIYVDGGALAEGWYHIVLSKSGQAWKFFSINLVAVS